MILRRFFNTNNLIKLLLSLPVILLVLYFLPVLGVIMLIARYFVYGSAHYYRAPIALIIIGLILLIPHGLELAMANFGFELTIPYFKEFIGLGIYPKLIEYAQRLFVIGIVFLIVSAVTKAIAMKLSGKLSNLLREWFTAKETTKQLETKERIAKSEEKIETSKHNTPHGAIRYTKVNVNLAVMSLPTRRKNNEG